MHLRFQNSVKCCGEKEIRTLEAFTPSLFSRQLPWPTGLSPCCEWLYSKQLIQKGNGFTDRHDSPASSHPHPYPLHTVEREQRKQNDSNIHSSLNRRPFCHWTMFPSSFYILHFVGPERLELSTPGVKDRYSYPIELRTNAVMTDRVELSTFTVSA